MNHVIAANQPLHWLRLFYDITSEKSCILFVQPAMSKNRTVLSLYQRIEEVNANGTYDIEANRESHVAYVWLNTSIRAVVMLH